MNNKHPERRPVDQVEGAISVDSILEGTAYLKPSSAEAFHPLVRLMVMAAERKLREQQESTTDDKASAA